MSEGKKRVIRPKDGIRQRVLEYGQTAIQELVDRRSYDTAVIGLHAVGKLAAITWVLCGPVKDVELDHKMSVPQAIKELTLACFKLRNVTAFTMMDFHRVVYRINESFGARHKHETAGVTATAATDAKDKHSEHDGDSCIVC